MKQFTPAAERSKRELGPVLARLLPPSGTVLEVASGSGQHVVHFGACMPALVWQPSERLEHSIESIAEWVATSGLSNVRSPIRLDVTERPWTCGRVNAVLALNLIHITDTAVRDGLFALAAAVLGPGEPLILYGPFYTGQPTERGAPAEAPPLLSGWGLREIVPSVEHVAAAAQAHGLQLDETIPMSAAHHCCISLRRTDS